MQFSTNIKYAFSFVTNSEKRIIYLFLFCQSVINLLDIVGILTFSTCAYIYLNNILPDSQLKFFRGLGVETSNLEKLSIVLLTVSILCFVFKAFFAILFYSNISQKFPCDQAEIASISFSNSR
jgi:hypothetical protein